MSAWSARGALLVAVAAPVAAQEPYEPPPVGEASALLPAEQLQGDAYRIEPDVSCEGFLYRFRFTTPSGSFTADGLADVPIRVNEANALAILAERSAGEVAAESAGNAVEGAVTSVVKVVEEPGETAKGAASGVGRWAKRTLLGARKLAHDVKQSVDEARADDPEAEVPAETEGGADEEDQPNAAGQTAKAVSKWVLGYSGARRDYAAGLGVDPYTRNPLLAAELDRVAWSASAASFGTGMMIPTLPLTPQLQTAYDLVWTSHPGDLEVRNRKLATEWGVDRRTRDAFFWNDAWTPTEQTAFVQAIESLGPTPGKRTLIEASAAVTEPAEIARWVADLGLVARLHADGLSLARVQGSPEGAFAWTGDGALVPLAVDRLFWTAELEAWLRAHAERIEREIGPDERRVLATPAEVSDRTRAVLVAAGWNVLTVPHQAR